MSEKCARCGDRLLGDENFGEFTGTECVDNQHEDGTYGPHTSETDDNASG